MDSPSSVVEKESTGVIAIKGADDAVSRDIDPGGKRVEKGIHAEIEVIKNSNRSHRISCIIRELYTREKK